ncbi:MAG TPA: efflux RND transporter periplasmic adaptor subunit [Candidatus Hydrogenedentes bacterium]|nr:efflux RND transporter periplasmic adaptor subunit [Candidatus Hydrogenedentota bacterium]HRT19434.1 efflux RND transporter periplasmic adaptor subunit [Candidatus Hydrogenedentota bacterium]HRT63832.1 efflux RND transporter periplasmic adaptor subunit [Candidatus Hydrogenedentota bacterium]
MKTLLRVLVLVSILAGVTGGAIYGSQFVFKPAPLIVQGEVDATQVDVAPKIAGRVETLFVREGDAVAKGQILAALKSPEIEAKAAQATSAREAASAVREKADNGARIQEIEAARHAWQMALANAELARKSYERVMQLYESDHVSPQTLDEAMAKWKAATQMAEAARATHEMAVAGAREEDKKAARAIENQAGGVVSEVQSYLSETELKAPIDGEIAEAIIDPGELATPGFPVFSIVDLNDVWVVFNLREDLLGRMPMGTKFEGRVPALNGRAVEWRVDFIKPLGDFATWRATKTAGDFDMKTFEVRARPVSRVEGLRPGMSVLVEWDKLPVPADRGHEGA